MTKHMTLALLIATALFANANGGEYLVVDVSGGATADRWPVRESAVPPELSSDQCRTGEMWLRKVSGGIAAGVFEITQRQYWLATGANPSRHRGWTRPVESVSWKAANAFAALVSKKTGMAFRLPAAAEWVAACRAGVGGAYNNAVNPRSHHEPRIDEICRYGYNRFDGRGGFSEHAIVGSFKPNAWGLYDMHGNVAEWCSDAKGEFPPVHPLRGGCWYECMEVGSAMACACHSDMGAYFYADDDYASDLAGFRLFCEAKEAK